MVKALTNEGAIVFDPFTGVGSTGVAATLHNRTFLGCELDKKYINIAHNRILETLAGNPKYRPINKPIYDHTKSNLSKKPKR